MLESLGPILAGLALMVLVGVVLLCYVAWRSRRRTEDAETAQPSRVGGNGGPSEPA